MAEAKGTFVISLDFELYWGAWPGEETGKLYKESILGVHAAVPALLELFKEYEIHATWATVGLLFFGSRDDLIKGLPGKKPGYVNSKLSAYNHLDEVGENETEDPYHYAASLLKMIKSCLNQEIGTHTFSHYYCLERGQDVDEFRSDLRAAIRAARNYDIHLQSMVFPMNQVNSDYLSVCKEFGIKCYRGNPDHYFYNSSRSDESLAKRGLRLIDTFSNITGHHCYSLDDVERKTPFNIKWSRWLRPYSERLKFLEPFRLHRILSGLNYAAKKGLVYHLWWHPYNFGINLEKNISFLRGVLDHYEYLRSKYGMKSLNMAEVAERLSQ